MTVLQAMLLGFFQGIAEFLPISSSGHLLVFKDILAAGDVPVLFDVLLHVATLGSVIVVFRKRVAGIIASTVRWAFRRSGPADAENLALIPPAALATAITAVVGLAIDRIDLTGYPVVVSGLFIVTAVILVAASRMKVGNAGYTELGWKHGIMVGLAQGIGVFPGISRSGITISAGLASGMKRAEAGEFSFLLSIPAILGALVLKLDDIGELSGAVSLAPMLAAAGTSFIVGIAALLTLMPLVRKGKLAWFSLYLIPAGIAGILFFA